MKNKKGFTLVELVIVIIIVGILSVVAVPIYRGYTVRAMASEGKALMGSINAAEAVYYTQWGCYAKVTTETAFTKWLGLDVRANKYFKKYKITTGSFSSGQYWLANSVGGAGTKAAGVTAKASGSVYDNTDGEGGGMWLSIVDSEGVEIDHQ